MAASRPDVRGGTEGPQSGRRLAVLPGAGGLGRVATQSGARLRSLRWSERRWIPSRRAASEIFPPQSDRMR